MTVRSMHLALTSSSTCRRVMESISEGPLRLALLRASVNRSRSLLSQLLLHLTQGGHIGTISPTPSPASSKSRPLEDA